jgi:squalene-associated FAD-dependent desaturase
MARAAHRGAGAPGDSGRLGIGDVSVRPDVIVIGGGCAGLSAATALAARGAAVRVLEGRRRLGGRSRSWTDPATGDVEDNGQHLVLRCYRSFLSFLERTGGIDHVEFQKRLSVVLLEEGQRPAVFEPPALQPPFDLLAAFVRLRGIGLRDMVSAGALVRDARRGLRELDRATVSDWLDRHGQSAAVRERLWHPLVLATLNARPDEAPAALLAVVLREALLAGPDSSRIGFFPRGLGAAIVDPAVRYLVDRGSEISMGKVAVSLETGPAGRFRAVKCRDGSRHEAGAAVLAVPPAEAAGLLPLGAAEFGREQARALGSSAILAVHFWLDRKVIDRAMVGFVGSPVHWVFDRAATGDGNGRGYVALVASTADELMARSPAEIAKMARHEIDRFLPSARGAVVERWRVLKQRDATPRFTPANIALRPPASTALGNLVLAGDWTRTGLPATLESAAASGELAARLCGSGH